METKYIDAKDKNVAIYVLYSDGSNLYLDVDLSKKATTKDAMDAFYVGGVIVDHGIEYTPIYMSDDHDVKALTYVKNESGTLSAVTVLSEPDKFNIGE